MTTGKVKWFDPDREDARLVSRSGREYPARAFDLEPAARSAGARVTFGLVREGGVTRAVNVRLRSGTRTSPRQRNFGDLAGSRRPDLAGREPPTREHPDRRRGPAPLLPAEVARAWVAAMERGDLASALALYAPDAVVHAPEGEGAGRRAVQARLEECVLLGVPHPDLRLLEQGSIVTVSWGPTEADTVRTPAAERRSATRLRVEHGEIVEQWA